MVQIETDALITSADWSVDGSRIAYDLGDKIFVRMPNHARRRIYQGTDPHSLSWSPDGRFIAFVEGKSRLFHGATGFVNTAPSEIVVIPEGGGVADTITPTGETDLSPTWGPDSRSLFFVSDRDGAKDIYRVRLTSRGGVASPRERLTTGLNAQTLALSRDGRTLAFSTLLHSANAWMLRLHPGGIQFDDDAVQVTNGDQVIERLNISPDGKWLYFDSNRRGNADVYRLALDRPEAEPVRLTTDSAGDFAPTVSPDGREIVFHSLRLGNRDLWLMSSDGTNQRPLTTSQRDEYGAVWSRDGSSIGFSADSAGMIWLGVVGRDRAGHWGVPHVILPGTPGMPAWSPDGTRLAVLREGAIMVFSLPDRKLISLHRVSATSAVSLVVLWSSDGRSLYFRQPEPDGRATLLAIPVSGGPPAALVRQRDASRSSVRSTWFTDGRLYFFTIDRYEGDISTLDVREAAP
jgi:Tol biopolymer transport system component